MAEHDCNADEQANALFTSLTADSPTPPTLDLSDSKYDFTKDADSDLYKDVSTVTLEELTEVNLEGEGVFDQLMQAVDLHIQREYKGNRITGDQYAKVYTEVTTAVLGQSVSFLLQRDQAKWSAITAQMQARIAEIQATEALINLEKTKVEAQQAVFEMQNAGAQYALTKMQIANADAAYCLTLAQTKSEAYKRNWLMPAELAIQEYTRNNMMPIEYAAKQVTADRILPAEAAVKEFENRVLQPLEQGIQKFQLEETLPVQQATQEYQLNQMMPVALGIEQHKLNFQMPAQTDMIKEQRETQRAQTLETRSDALTPISGLLGRQKNLLDMQISLTGEQVNLTAEQKEAERSKTMDTRSDGSTIVEGMNGKQKDLYDQQIDSFIKDAKQKAAKMYLDGWITQKTLDENLAAPTELNVPSVSSVLASLRTANSL
jgi:hypothetical protein